MSLNTALSSSLKGGLHLNYAVLTKRFYHSFLLSTVVFQQKTHPVPSNPPNASHQKSFQRRSLSCCLLHSPHQDLTMQWYKSQPWFHGSVRTVPKLKYPPSGHDLELFSEPYTAKVG